MQILQSLNNLSRKYSKWIDIVILVIVITLVVVSAFAQAEYMHFIHITARSYKSGEIETDDPLQEKPVIFLRDASGSVYEGLVFGEVPGATFEAYFMLPASTSPGWAKFFIDEATPMIDLANNFGTYISNPTINVKSFRPNLFIVEKVFIPESEMPSENGDSP